MLLAHFLAVGTIRTFYIPRMLLLPGQDAALKNKNPSVCRWCILKAAGLKRLDSSAVVPNSNVNNNGKPNLNNSNVSNDNDARVAVKYESYWTLFLQPPICLRASVRRAWIFNILVSFAICNSSIVRSFKAVSSASASASKR